MATILLVRLVSVDFDVTISVLSVDTSVSSVATSVFSVATSDFSVVTSVVNVLTLVLRDDMLEAAVDAYPCKVVICPPYVVWVVCNACCYVFKVFRAVMILVEACVKVCTFVFVVCY